MEYVVFGIYFPRDNSSWQYPNTEYYEWRVPNWQLLPMRQDLNIDKWLEYA